MKLFLLCRNLQERNSEKDDGALLREVQELRSYTKVDDPEDLVEESVLPEFLHTLKLSAIVGAFHGRPERLRSVEL